MQKDRFHPLPANWLTKVILILIFIYAVLPFSLFSFLISLTQISISSISPLLLPALPPSLSPWSRFCASDLHFLQYHCFFPPCFLLSLVSQHHYRPYTHPVLSILNPPLTPWAISIIQNFFAKLSWLCVSVCVFGQEGSSYFYSCQVISGRDRPGSHWQWT